MEDRLSLRARTLLLASFGMSAILFTDSAVRLRAQTAAGRAGLVERANLLATIQADALSVPMWNLDTDLLGAALDALMRDPDFAGAQITRPDGSVLQSRGDLAASDQGASTPVRAIRAIRYVDQGHSRDLGRLGLSLRTARLQAAMAEEVQAGYVRLIALLASVLLLMHVAFRQLARPLDRLATALTRLAAGEQEVRIPALDRRDEVGALARGLQVFKDTAFELARTQGEYRAVIEQAALGIYRMDANGTLMSVNAAMLRVTGDPDMASLLVRVKKGGKASIGVNRELNSLEAIQNPQDGHGGTLRDIYRADGTIATTRQTVRAVQDGGGQLLGYVGTIEDVTEQHRRMGEERMRIRAAVESAGDAMLIADVDGTPLFVNRAFVQILGYDLPALTEAGGIVSLLRDGAAGRRVARAIAGDSCRMESDLVARSGSAVPMAVSVGPIFGEQGEVVGSLAICTNLSDRLAAQAQLDHMAHHDSLTGLPNRVAFGIALAAALSTGDEVAVLCLDLDRFKEVNEALGHAAGDDVLQQVASRLNAAMGDGEMVARAGADEFVVLQRKPGQPKPAEALASRLLEHLSRPYPVGGGEVVISASLGIALAPHDCSLPNELLRFGALALEEAKVSGRGVARRFSPDMDHALQVRSALERDLRRAIADEVLAVHFQPQCRLATGEIVGAEALLRWTHPERGAVSPAEFIPLAEETGLIDRLGEWVLNQSCQAAVGWAQKLRVAVNISPAQFRTGDLVAQVRAALALSGLEPSRLELEITEGVMLHDTEATLTTLHAIKALGVRLAMDDFGTGYSSLSYLRRMPIDKIKIDQSFIRALGREPAAIALVRSIVGIGRGLGIEANAEGVETEEQAMLLRLEGCHEVQGWLYGRPCAADLFAANLLAANLANPQARAA